MSAETRSLHAVTAAADAATAARPASDWLVDSITDRLCEPVKIHRPGAGSRSMISCKYEADCGQF